MKAITSHRVYEVRVLLVAIYQLLALLKVQMPWTAVDCRDAIIAVYQDDVEPREIPKRFSGVSRQHVTALAGQLPDGLVDDDKRRQLTRAANAAVGLKSPGCYTDWELQRAMLDYSTKKQKPGACTLEYGIPGATLRSKRKEIDAAVVGTPSAKKARAIVATMFKQSPGV